MHRTAMMMAMLLFLASATVHAQDAPDPERGRQLHARHCQRCHDDSIYTRQDSIIYSYKALQKRVHFCERMAGAGWHGRDFDDVISYLNQRFYKFKTTQ